MTGQKILLSTWSASTGLDSFEDACLSRNYIPCALDPEMNFISGNELASAAVDAELSESGDTSTIRLFLGRILDTTPKN